MANCALGKIEDFKDSNPSCNFVPDEIDEVSIASVSYTHLTLPTMELV